MGNGKDRKRTNVRFGTGNPGKHYIVAENPERMLTVVDDSNAKVVGYLVPKSYAWLYYLFPPLGLWIQEHEDFRTPTTEELGEISKRYVRKLGESSYLLLFEAISEVLEREGAEPIDWKPTETWKFEAPSEVASVSYITFDEDEKIGGKEDSDEEDRGEEEADTGRDVDSE